MTLSMIAALAAGLSMDAFAISLSKGISVGKAGISHSIITELWFGSFQAIMPIIGFFLGTHAGSMIESYDHWIAFALLLLIGGSMIRESKKKDEPPADASFSAKAMFPLAIASSIDALAAGVALSTAGGSIAEAAALIGIFTFCLSAIGVKAGSRLGAAFGSKAQAAGGIILCLIGIRILCDHLGLI